MSLLDFGMDFPSGEQIIEFGSLSFEIVCNGLNLEINKRMIS